MKVAKKSPKKRLVRSRQRATLTLSMETYQKIDTLRGDAPRATWVQGLVEAEEARRERQRFIEAVNASYTPEVCRETLRINDEYPIHEG
jgi:hypothetical protein